MKSTTVGIIFVACYYDNVKTRNTNSTLYSIKQCPECYYTFEPPSFGRAVCPACGYMFPKQERSVEHEEDTELKQITGFVLDYDSPDQCRNMHELQQYAKKMGYKPGWAYFQGKNRGFI